MAVIINPAINYHSLLMGSTQPNTGYSWTGNSGLTTTISYNFNSANSSSEVSAASQSYYVQALSEWSKVANITFNLNTSNSQINGINFAVGDLSSISPNVLGITQPYGIAAQDRLTKALIIMDDRFASASSMAPGTVGYSTILHEIGHALGLEHSGNYNQGEVAPYLTPAEDNIQNTIMSYYDGPLVVDGVNSPRTPMFYDIAAIQYLYGANQNYNAGNNTYQFVSGYGPITRTLWDGGGQDMLSFSLINSAARIDLREGINFYTQYENNLIWNAFGTNIENAQGSNFGDTITGNTLANILYGGDGNDTMNGFEGNDSMFGETGTDYLEGLIGADYIRGGQANDTIFGGDNNDTLYGDNVDNLPATDGGDFINGGTGADYIWAGAGNDTANGDDDNDVLYLDSGSSFHFGNDIGYGGNGIDVLVGEGGSDTLYGGDMYDILYGDNANFTPQDAGDSIYGEGGNDVIYAGGGNDTVYGGNDNDVMYLGVGNDSAYGDAGVDVMVGDAGSDRLYGGTGNDIYYYGATHTGADSIMDFEGTGAAAGDRIRVASANMNGNGLMTTADLAAALTYSGGNATLNLGGGITITLVGVAAGMTASDFLIG